MHDLDDEERALEERLRALDPAGATPPGLDRFVSATLSEARPRRVTRRARLVIASIAAATLVSGGVTAGISYQDYLMSREPFVGLDPGEYRTDASARFVPPLGQDEGEHCNLYPEFRGLTGDQLRRLDDLVRERDWSDLGADVMAAARTSGAIHDGMTADQIDATYSVALKARLAVELAEAVPDLRVYPSPAGDFDVEGPSLAGYTIVCRGDW
ncbi:hypothetical protein [Schumannella sp. 10F1B-5-1]|uniref:hypothetical protein n=1 Tax=Schumannella sp. 10F1B-5-1 TaxID=2590780 RepID=UPI001131029E|nr:hypothetical protein [Schumannella sp. 10F1B-5-1]TPW73552.1 hypothetical protein FJ658_05035 [Schumannella sp. 10F1B-5-1]